MSVNPVLRLVEAPAATLADLGWACILVAALVATWWAAGRNLLWLDAHWQEGWQVLPPFWPALRMVALLVVTAVDLWLLAALVAVLA
ncbi:MAG: hypothetical protein V5A30_05920 [Haloarculaceae archaeon]